MIPSVPDVREVEVRTHGLAAVGQVRHRDGGYWWDMTVVTGTVTVNAMGELPNRSLELTVMNLPVGTDLPLLSMVDIYGSWVRVFHRVLRTDNTSFDVPVGIFRVNQVVPDLLAGTVAISAQDAGALVADYALPSLAAGEQLAGASNASVINRMLTEALNGIVSWWSMAIDNTDAPTLLGTARAQYEGSRVEAVQRLAKSADRAMMVCIDGEAVFCYRFLPAVTDPPVIDVTPGMLGNLETLQSTVDRAGIANVGTITYTIPVDNGQDNQKRALVEYTDVGSLFRAGGPFGRVTVVAESSNVTNDADAVRVIMERLAGSRQNVRDMRVDISPIYGIEAGDVVLVHARDTEDTTPAYVTGATIPLTADSGWSLTLRAFSPDLDIESLRRRFFPEYEDQL